MLPRYTAYRFLWKTRPNVCWVCRTYGTAAASRATVTEMQRSRSQSARDSQAEDLHFAKERQAKYIQVNSQKYTVDSWTNVTESILSKVNRQLHTTPHHPLNILKSRIESILNTMDDYKIEDSLHPVVTVKQNFDDLLIPTDHPGRSKSDTYYINSNHVLRTHTSAHQTEMLNKGRKKFLLTADVYRRDEIDKSHYPVFHQMEGVHLFSREALSSLTILPDLQYNSSPENPIQRTHTEEGSLKVMSHLQHTLIQLITQLIPTPNLQYRWIPAYFPFTSPSFELEILFDGNWLEVLGCGVVQQEILDGSGNGDQVGWAFGLGLERLAMILFSIPDIRLMWTTDTRFLSQFHGLQLSSTTDFKNVAFKPFSKYPALYQDISFYLPSNNSSPTNNAPDSTMNDLTDLLRTTLYKFSLGDIIESVTLVDAYTNPKTGKKSKCYRIMFRSFDRTLGNDEIKAVMEEVGVRMKEFGWEVR